MPSFVAVIGPIVEPHGMLLRDTKVWSGTLFLLATVRKNAAPRADVAYR
jgi:hypothetical protein